MCTRMKVPTALTREELVSMYTELYGGSEIRAEYVIDRLIRKLDINEEANIEHAKWAEDVEERQQAIE